MTSPWTIQSWPQNRMTRAPTSDAREIPKRIRQSHSTNAWTRKAPLLALAHKTSSHPAPWHLKFQLMKISENLCLHVDKTRTKNKKIKICVWIPENRPTAATKAANQSPSEASLIRETTNLVRLPSNKTEAAANPVEGEVETKRKTKDRTVSGTTRPVETTRAIRPVSLDILIIKQSRLLQELIHPITWIHILTCSIPPRGSIPGWRGCRSRPRRLSIFCGTVPAFFLRSNLRAHRSVLIFHVREGWTLWAKRPWRLITGGVWNLTRATEIVSSLTAEVLISSNKTRRHLYPPANRLAAAVVTSTASLNIKRTRRTRRPWPNKPRTPRNYRKLPSLTTKLPQCLNTWVPWARSLVSAASRRTKATTRPTCRRPILLRPPFSPRQPGTSTKGAPRTLGRCTTGASTKDSTKTRPLHRPVSIFHLKISLPLETPWLTSKVARTPSSATRCRPIITRSVSEAFFRTRTRWLRLSATGGRKPRPPIIIAVTTNSKPWARIVYHETAAFRGARLFTPKWPWIISGETNKRPSTREPSATRSPRTLSPCRKHHFISQSFFRLLLGLSSWYLNRLHLHECSFCFVASSLSVT